MSGGRKRRERVGGEIDEVAGRGKRRRKISRDNERKRGEQLGREERGSSPDD